MLNWIGSASKSEKENAGVRKTAAGGDIKMRRTLCRIALSIVSTLFFPFFCMAVQLPTAQISQQMMQLKEARQRLIARMNAPDAAGKLMELDDEQMKSLLNEGW
jgi:hypothetical protein